MTGRSNLPELLYYSRRELDINDDEMAPSKRLSKRILDHLSDSTLTQIKNAFDRGFRCSSHGACYVHLDELKHLLRTGNSGADTYMVRNGIGRLSSPSKHHEIDEVDSISVSDLYGLLKSRKTQVFGNSSKQYHYLCYVEKLLDYLVEHSSVRTLGCLFNDQVNKLRPRLKQDRMSKYNIRYCEFSGQKIEYSKDFEFAHIESVVTNPEKAVDIDNGVIILKSIHRQLTDRGIHDFEGMYEYCLESKYYTDWADPLVD